MIAEHFRKLHSHIMGDSLYKNSLYLVVNNFAITGLGFIFWTVNTHIFPSADIGIANTLLSVMNLITIISVLGFYYALIKYLPKEENKEEMISSTFIVSLACAALISIGYLAYQSRHGKQLFNMDAPYMAMFVVFNMVWLIYTLIDAVYIAFRRSEAVLLKNIVFSVFKIVLSLGVLAFMKGFGIFTAWSVSALVSVAAALVLFPVKLLPRINTAKIQKIFRFSFSNYISGFFSSGPYYIIPIIITYILSPELTAYYSIAFMFANILFNIPKAVSQSLFAEMAHTPEVFERQLKKALLISLGIVVPAAVFLYFAGPYLLLIFGKEYAAGSVTILRLFLIASIPACVMESYFIVVSVFDSMKRLIISNLFISIGIVSLSLLLVSMELTGLGLAWVITYYAAAAAMAIDFMIMRKRLAR